MNTNNKHPHFSRTVLHNGEERVKRIFRDQLAELAGLLEVGISLLVVVDRKSTRLNSSHTAESRMPSSA